MWLNISRTGVSAYNFSRKTSQQSKNKTLAIIKKKKKNTQQERKKLLCCCINLRFITASKKVTTPACLPADFCYNWKTFSNRQHGQLEVLGSYQNQGNGLGFLILRLRLFNGKQDSGAQIMKWLKRNPCSLTKSYI